MDVSNKRILIFLPIICNGCIYTCTCTCTLINEQAYMDAAIVNKRLEYVKCCLGYKCLVRPLMEYDFIVWSLTRITVS